MGWGRRGGSLGTCSAAFRHSSSSSHDSTLSPAAYLHPHTHFPSHGLQSEEEEEFYKLRAANKTDHLCHGLQSHTVMVYSHSHMHGDMSNSNAHPTLKPMWIENSSMSLVPCDAE